MSEPLSDVQFLNAFADAYRSAVFRATYGLDPLQWETTGFLIESTLDAQRFVPYDEEDEEDEEDRGGETHCLRLLFCKRDSDESLDILQPIPGVFSSVRAAIASLRISEDGEGLGDEAW